RASRRGRVQAPGRDPDRCRSGSRSGPCFDSSPTRGSPTTSNAGMSERHRLPYVLCSQTSSEGVRLSIQRRGGRAAPAALVGGAALAPAASGDDWPQLWGPTVTATVEPKDSPSGAALRELWRPPLGSGL